MQKPVKSKFRILVIGGGVAGFAASIGLRRKGHKVTVIERSSALQTFGGSLLIPSNALRVLDDYGLLEVFQNAKEPWDTHTIYRHDGKVLDVLTNEANEKLFGYEMLNVQRPTYQRLLYEAAVREGVNVRFGSQVESIEEGIPSITLSTGERIDADLIIGADGIKSKVRTAVLGGKDIHLLPNSTCFQCTISRDLMMKNPLTAPLMSQRALQSWWGPNRFFICGRKNQGATYDASFFTFPNLSTSLENLQAKSTQLADSDVSSSNSRHWDRRGDLNDIVQNVDDFEPLVQAFVQMIKPQDCLLWKVAAVPDLKSWVSPSGKVALLGDAAHAMSPHLGQGAAVSIEDSGVLAECLGRAKSIADIPNALRAYEQVQKPRAEKIKKTAEASGKVKTLEAGPQQRKRDDGFQVRLEKGPRYEFWRASGYLEWIYGFNYKEEAKKELDRVFGIEGVDRARM